MPYQFVLSTPFNFTNHNSRTIEYFSDEGERGDVPNIVSDVKRAKRFATQEEAAQAVPLFMHAKQHKVNVIRASLGRIASEFIKHPISDPILIEPIE
jgi:methionine salvage enolase-phosphatase E1